MTVSLSRLAVAALLLVAVAPVGAAAESGAYVDIRPTRALRVAAATQAPEIPGVTYPRNAPPDLVADIVVEPAAPVASEPDVAPTQTAAPAAAPLEPTPTIAHDTASAATSLAATSAPTAPVVTPITLRLDVDLATQRLTITERGEVKSVWPISSGRAPFVTKPGTFKPQWASRMWYSRQYEMAPMPHAVFFNGGIAFHATQATHLLGRPASHGCVRLSPQNARALYGMIHAHGYAHTEIVVSGAPKVATAEKRKPRARVSTSQSETGFWSFF